MKRNLAFLGLAVAAMATATAQNNVISYVLEFSNGGALNSRTEFTYDVQGLMTEKHVLHPNSSGELENYSRTTYGYDSEQRQNLVENYLWDANTLSYYGLPSDDEAKTVTTFNSDNMPSQVLYYQWGASGWGNDDQWKYNGTFVYSGSTATETRYEQINGIPKGDPSVIMNYTYDSQWRIVEKIKNLYMFDFETYDYAETPTDRWVYEYDDHNNITIEQHYSYIDNSDPWEDPWGSPKPQANGDDANWALLYSYKYEYTYDSNGNIATKKQYSWDEFEVDYMLTYDFYYEYHYASNDALSLDYSNDFDSEDALAGFVIEDGNGDGNSWLLNNGTVTCSSTVASQAPEILYLPAIRFTTDNEVEISFNARVADSSAPSKVQMILCDNDNERTPLGTIGDIWEINCVEDTLVYGRIVVDESRPYVIGICFDNVQVGSLLSIDNLNVKNGRSTSTPKPASSFTATPARDGSLQVKLIWYPSPYTIADEYINSLDDMELYREGVEEPIYTTGAVGTTLAQQYTDILPEAGTYTYRLYQIKNGLRSDAAVLQVKVGYPVPTITNFSATENDDHSVTLSWDHAPESDGAVKYYIVRNGDTVLANEHEGTSFVDYTIVPENGQTYCYYVIYPFNEIGYGDAVTSQLLFVGMPSATPFKESFPDGSASHLWMNEIVNGYSSAWGIGSGAAQGMASQDGDDGLAAFLSTTIDEGGVVRFTSEKIDISQLANPELSFYMYHLHGSTTGDALVIEASTDNGEYETLAGPFAASGYDNAGWVQHLVSLDKLAGSESLRLSFRGISAATHDIFIDNITVDEQGQSSVNNALAIETNVYATDGKIVVSAVEKSHIQVYTTSGVILYDAVTTDARISAESGIYIVVVNGNATKVITK